MGLFDIFKKKKKNESAVSKVEIPKESAAKNVALPDIYKDVSFDNANRYLSSYGTGILNGNIPDYYKSLGETGSPEFERVLANSNRDIMTGVTEAAALRGRGRGGSLTGSVANALSDNVANLRFNDYLTSQQGKQFLLGTGINTLEGVRGAGLENQSQTNTFNLGRSGLDLQKANSLDAFALDTTGLELKKANYADDYNQKLAEERGKAIGSIVRTIASVGAAPFTGGASLAFAANDLTGGAFDAGGAIDFFKLLKKPKTDTVPSMFSSPNSGTGLGKISGSFGGLDLQNLLKSYR